MITVLVVDDHARVRDSLSELLSEAGDMQVVGECSDGDEVLEADRRLHPDVLLMDVSMRRIDGLVATAGVIRERPEARVVILTGSLSAALVRQAAEAGAVGFQLKGDDPLALVEAVRAVASGRTAWSDGALAVLPQAETSHCPH